MEYPKCQICLKFKRNRRGKLVWNTITIINLRGTISTISHLTTCLPSLSRLKCSEARRQHTIGIAEAYSNSLDRFSDVLKIDFVRFNTQVELKIAHRFAYTTPCALLFSWGNLTTLDRRQHRTDGQACACYASNPGIFASNVDELISLKVSSGFLIHWLFIKFHCTFLGGVLVEISFSFVNFGQLICWHAIINW